MTVNILAIGDVVGDAGLRMLEKKLRSLQKLKGVSFTVVNGENVSLMGLTPRQADDIFAAGADVITLGNHTFSRHEICDYLDDCRYILRPSNLAPQNPGRGWGVFEASFGRVGVLNLIGRCGMDFGPDNPFHEAVRALDKMDCRIKLIDFHAEATSEKLAMAHYLDGKASALWGTHTHVQTSDACAFPQGLGYITDLGMTGPAFSVIGIKPEQSVSMYLGNPKRRYEPASGSCKIEGVLFEIDTETGRCISAEAIRITE